MSNLALVGITSKNAEKKLKPIVSWQGTKGFLALVQNGNNIVQIGAEYLTRRKAMSEAKKLLKWVILGIKMREIEFIIKEQTNKLIRLKEEKDEFSY